MLPLGILTLPSAFLVSPSIIGMPSLARTPPTVPQAGMSRINVTVPCGLDHMATPARSSSASAPTRDRCSLTFGTTRDSVQLLPHLGKRLGRVRLRTTPFEPQ